MPKIYDTRAGAVFLLFRTFLLLGQTEDLMIASSCCHVTRRAEILLASKSNYRGRALGLGMKWLKFEFSDM